MPNTKAVGNDNSTSSPPRTARGSPHPGRSTISAKIVTKAIPSRIAAIFPRRISVLSFQKNTKTKLQTPLIISALRNQCQSKYETAILALLGICVVLFAWAVCATMVLDLMIMINYIRYA
jgi:hypothetical protein